MGVCEPPPRVGLVAVLLDRLLAVTRVLDAPVPQAPEEMELRHRELAGGVLQVPSAHDEGVTTPILGREGGVAMSLGYDGTVGHRDKFPVDLALTELEFRGHRHFPIWRKNSFRPELFFVQINFKHARTSAKLFGL